MTTTFAPPGRSLPCPACGAPTRRTYRPNLLDPGDVEPYQWCTNCTWDTDTTYLPKATP